MEENQKRSVGWVAIILLVVLLLLGVFAAWRHENESSDISKDLERRVELTVLYLEALRYQVPAKFADDIDKIEEFIVENPKVLEDPDSVHIPKEVQRAFDRVSAVVVGSGGAEEIDPPEGEVAVGQQYTIQGVINKEETNEENAENPLGPVYSIKDETLNTELYFQFSPEVSKLVDETMLGKEVKMVIEITSVEDEGVTYKVISGPILVESAS